MTDVQWERVAEVLPSSDGCIGRPFRDHRLDALGRHPDSYNLAVSQSSGGQVTLALDDKSVKCNM